MPIGIANQIRRKIKTVPYVRPTADQYTKILMHFNDDMDSFGGFRNNVNYPINGILSNDKKKLYTGIWGPTGNTGIRVVNYSSTGGTVSTIATSLCTINFALNSTGTTLYAAGYGATNGANNGDKVYVVNTANDTLINTITVASGVHSLTVSPDDKFLYIACENAGLYMVDLTTQTLTATVANGSVSGTSGGRYAITMSPDGNKLLVSTGSSVQYYSVDKATGSLTGYTTLTGFSNAYTVIKTSKYAYYLNNGNGTVIPVDFATGTKGTAITVGSGPYGGCVAPDGVRIYVANNSGNSVSVIDTNRNTVIETLSGSTWGFSSPRGCVATNSKMEVISYGNNSICSISYRSFDDRAQNPLTHSVNLFSGGETVTDSTYYKFGKSLSITAESTGGGYPRFTFDNSPINNVRPIVFGNQQFTIEFWSYKAGNQNYRRPILMMGSTADYQGPVNIYLGAGITNKLYADVYYTNGWGQIISPNAIPSGWNHIALVRESNSTIKLYLNGSLQGQVTTLTSTDSMLESNKIWIYHYPFWSTGAVTYDYAWMDELRVKVGVAEYTDNFTPQTSEFYP